MGKQSSRGDRNRNRRPQRLRELLPTSNTVLGDPADREHVAALTAAPSTRC